MRYLLTILLVILTLFSCKQNKEYFITGTPESVGLDSEMLQPIHDTIKTWVNKGKLMGAEVLVIKDGKQIMNFAEGWSDFEEGRPLRTNSIYRIRSQAKPYTAIAILQLVEKGLIKLDDPVSEYIASFDNERSRGITVHQLLTHTAGLYGVFNKLSIDRSEYTSFEKLIDDIGEYGPASPVGEMIYSDEGAYTAGRLVAIVSGMPAEEYLQKNILDPMELNDTYLNYRPDVPWKDRMNSTYQYNALQCRYNKYWNNSMVNSDSVFVGVSSIRGTTMDYAKLLQILMDKGEYKGRQMLSEESVDLMTQNHEQWYIGDYGYFMMNQWDTEANKLLWFGHGGSDGTATFAFPEINTIIAYYTQSRYNGHRDDFMNVLRSLDYFKPYIPPSPYVIDKAAKFELIYSKQSKTALNKDYLGKYENILVEQDSSAYKITLDSPEGIKTLTTYALKDNELYGFFDDCDLTIIGLKFIENESTLQCSVSADANVKVTRSRSK